MKTKAKVGQKEAFGKKWHPDLGQNGYVQVSTFFLENYSSLKPYGLTYGEAMFVIHLMQYKWDEAAPYPAYKTIAKRMCVSVKTVRRYAQSLEHKGLLKRVIRQQETNRFLLDPLMLTLVKHQKNLLKIPGRSSEKPQNDKTAAKAAVLRG